ncbi:Mif2/CENP-C like-domain-containing protein [Mycena olivaceomarginata]|nr:Mif2/CENP-C like-domain-containing protein [Mycena olivaceomarginata]
MFLQSPGTQEMPNPNSPARNVRSDTAHSITNARGGVAAADGTGRVSQRGENCVDNIVEDRLEVDVDRSEEGLKADTATRVVVKDYKTGEFVTRRIAFTPKILTPTTKSEWTFQKIFGDKDCIAAGEVIIAANGRKPRKSSKDNTLIFFVIEGVVTLTVCEASITVASGGMFMIPRGNTYLIENNAARDAKLLFTQARRTSDNDEDDTQSKFQRMQKDLETERCTVAKQTAIIVDFTEKLQIAGEELQMETQMRRAAEVHAKEAVKELEEYKETFRAALKALEALAA